MKKETTITKPIKIEALLVRQVKPSGNSCHIAIPKCYENRIAVVFIKSKGSVLRIKKDTEKVENGIVYIKAEYTHNGGTDEFYVPKKKVDKIL